MTSLTFVFLISYQTNRFRVGIRLFSNWSQMASKYVTKQAHDSMESIWQIEWYMGYMVSLIHSLLISLCFPFKIKRVPEVSYFDAADLLGEVFVDTIDTVSLFSWNDFQLSVALTKPKLSF